MEETEAVCAGLVREYLYRKGFLDVLRLFDEETVSVSTEVHGEVTCNTQ
jgi:hypothetical protein